jgi:signal transduction histidine kinase
MDSVESTSTGDDGRAYPVERPSVDRPVERGARAYRARFGAATSYGGAILLVGLIAWLRWLIDPILGEIARFLPFVVAVVVSTYSGGIGPGIMSVLLSTVVGTFLFVDEPLSRSRADLFNVGLFTIEASLIAALTGALRRARDQSYVLVSRAEVAVRQKDQLVTRVSHEWRAPLNVLAGWAAQLTARPYDPEFIARAAANMMRAIESQKRLVEDLLDYSRGSRGRLSIHPVRLLIVTPLEASLETVCQQAAAKNIDLTLRLEDSGLRVWGDNQRLQQVLTNLLTNSIKFTQRGGRITVRAHRTGDLVEVQVEDNGAGIDPRKLDAVFEAFSQGDRARDAALGGLGLGLSIAREIVLLHAGTIEAASPGPGLGSTFTVRLPVSAAVAGTSAAVETASDKRR